MPSSRLLRRASAAASALLIACGGGAGNDDTEPREDPPAVAPSEPGAPPDSVLLRTGACPFECCVYGQWVARSAIPVASAERGTDTLFTLQPGDTVTAVTGNVHVTSLQRVVVTRDVPDPQSWPAGPPLAAGDTLFVLDYVGEGYYNVWRDGAVYEIQAFWVGESEWTPDGDAPAYSVGSPSTEWWVHVRSAARGEGWLRMPPGFHFDGSDACA